MRDVEQMVASPAEQVLSQITGVEHVMSISKPGVAVLAVQFKVGVPRTEALVRLYDAVNANADWLPRGLGVGPPLIKPRGIDDVPIVALTLYAKDRAVGAQELERVAHSLEIDLKRVPGTREVVTLGGPGRAALVELDPQRMASAGVTVAELRQALQAANMGAPVGELLGGNRSVAVEAGPFCAMPRRWASWWSACATASPIYLQEVATVREGVPPAKRYVWHGVGGAEPAEYPAVTIQISKKPGENAIDVANGVLRRVDELRNTVIPAGGGGGPEPQLRHHRQRQGPGADPQAAVRHRLRGGAGLPHAGAARGGRRRAAVVLTLAGTLFASWAWGFTLNRVSLFALIFSIGILVDDAIVVVENIHRQQQLHPDRTLAAADSRRGGRGGRPDGAGHADGDRGLVADGLPHRPDGAVHEPHPDQRQHGHAAVAGHRVQRHALAGALVDEACRPAAATPAAAGSRPGWSACSSACSRRCSTTHRGRRNRGLLGAGVALLIAVSLALPATGRGHPEDAALRQQVGVPGGGGHARGHAAGADGGRAARARRLPGRASPR